MCCGCHFCFYFLAVFLEVFFALFFFAPPAFLVAPPFLSRRCGTMIVQAEGNATFPDFPIGRMTRKAMTLKSDIDTLFDHDELLALIAAVREARKVAWEFFLICRRMHRDSVAAEVFFQGNREKHPWLTEGDE